MNQDALARVVEMRQKAADGTARRDRIAAKAGLREVAAAIPTDPSTLSRWERGEVAPRADAALRWAEVLDSIRWPSAQVADLGERLPRVEPVLTSKF